MSKTPTFARLHFRKHDVNVRPTPGTYQLTEHLSLSWLKLWHTPKSLFKNTFFKSKQTPKKCENKATPPKSQIFFLSLIQAICVKKF